MSLDIKLDELNSSKFKQKLNKELISLNQQKNHLISDFGIFCENNLSKFEIPNAFKVNVNGTSYFHNNGRDIEKYVKKINQIDAQILGIQKLGLVSQINLQEVKSPEILNRKLSELNLLFSSYETSVVVFLNNRKNHYIIDQKIIENGNSVLKTTDNKIIKSFDSKTRFENETSFLESYKGSHFFPDLLCKDDFKRSIVTPYYEILDLNSKKDYSSQISAFLAFMKLQKIRHNDISLFDEVYEKNGELKVIDWEYGTQDGLGPKKERTYEDECLLDAYKFFRKKRIQSFKPFLSFSKIAPKISENDNHNYVVSSFRLGKEHYPMFKDFISKIDELTGFNPLNFEYFHCSLGFSKQKNSEIVGNFQVSGLSDIKRIIDAQAINKNNYFLKIWRHWWQLFFVTDELNPVFQYRRAGIHERNKLLLDALSKFKRGGLVLDIGSNAGEISNLISSRGYKVLGFEPDREVWQLAVNKKLSNCIFRNSEIDWDEVENKEPDAAVMLSVFHRMWALKGREYAKKELLKLSKMVEFILFEGSTHQARYGLDSPGFSSNNLDEAHNWHLKIFNELLPNWSVKFLDFIPHTSQEPYRILYSIERIN